MYSLDGKTIDLVETQRQVIKEILDEKRKNGTIKSDFEYSEQEKTMMDKITEGEPKPFLKVREQTDTADAHEFNQSFEELTYDIRTVFSQVNQVEETINKHQRLNQSLLMSLELRIKKAEEELIKHGRTAGLYDSHQIYIENFIDPNGNELNPGYYTERDGTSLPDEFRGKLDTDREAIKLPTILSENALIGASGVQLGKLVITKQLGSGYRKAQNPANSLEKAIDNSDESFWSESLLVDSPIHVSLGPEYYHIDFGAVCEIEVRFDYMTELNELTFHMFGEYPLDIIAIRYYQTDNNNEHPMELINPAHTLSQLSSRTIENTTSYQFPDIQAKRLRILFNQRHYVKNDFIASKNNQRNLNTVFDAAQIGSTNLRIEEEIYAPVIQNKQEKDSSWATFRDIIKKADADIDSILASMNSDELQAVSKYEYNYGLYNLGIYRNEYQQTGIHVSKEIPVSGNVKTVSIETIEEHPAVVGEEQFTDIEYYVYDGEKWHPILPKHMQRIKCERLFIELTNGLYQTKTRFAAVGETIIKKNGIAVASIPQGQTSIVITDYDASAIYTADYEPAAVSKEINFLNTVTPRTVTKEFRGTNSKGIINLGYHPFVDKAKLNVQPPGYNPSYLSNEINGYLPIKIKLVDKNGYHIAQPTDSSDKGIQVENVTDYFNPEVSYLENYDETMEIWYQYRVVGNTIQFNQPIPEDTKIIVEYPHLVGHIRIKAILRRNIHGFHGLTPILYQYQAHFDTLK